jgi:hypothetical protein
MNVATSIAELRPLHARGLSGHLAIELAGTPARFLVEFRVPEDWDVAFPRPAVFVHRLDDGYSYRMTGSSGVSDLVEGDTFTAGIDVPFLSSYTTVRIDEINERQHYAKVTASYRPRQIFRVPDLVGELFGGAAVDGGGISLGERPPASHRPVGAPEGSCSASGRARVSQRN